MDPTSTRQKKDSFSSKTQAIAIGLVLSIIGSLICSSYAKDTITNIIGFSLLIAGIATFILGIFATAAATLKTRLIDQQTTWKVSKRMLLASVWSVGIGIVLTITGYLLGTTSTQYTVINDGGAGMLVAGLFASLAGIAGATMTTIKLQHSTIPEFSKTNLEVKRKKPTTQTLGKISIAFGIVITITGSIVASSYAKETTINYAGFATLLIGIGILSIGVSRTVVDMLKTRWNLSEIYLKNQPRIVLGSIWAIGIGAMLVINGSLIASSYEKSTFLNYAGFGTLIVGTAVFVYGMFETARISAMSAMGYLSKRSHIAKDNSEIAGQKTEPLSKRLRRVGKNLVETSAVLNLAGAMFALGLLFFSLWQLDLIVSGPVWWSSGSQGTGTGWSHVNGAYSNDYFQCFLWKTTVGQAYDTFFLLIFISFIVLFASAFFWPRFRTKNVD